jgi:hypothetical protein
VKGRASCEARPNSQASRNPVSAGDRVVGQQASLRVAQLGADAFCEVRNRRANEVEDNEAEAHDRGGQNDPVNSNGTSLVFQESGKLGHLWSLSWGVIIDINRCGQASSSPSSFGFIHKAVQSWREFGREKDFFDLCDFLYAFRLEG